jgi:hypothetical protein
MLISGLLIQSMTLGQDFLILASMTLRRGAAFCSKWAGRAQRCTHPAHTTLESSAVISY